MKKYLITSTSYHTQDTKKFAQILKAQIEKEKPDFVLFRDKENEEYDVLAEVFVEVCKPYTYLKYFLHSNANLAKELHASGVHLTSTQSQKIKYAKSLGLEVILSTHTVDEVLQAEKEGVDYVTYSPIFESPDKGTPKGVENLQDLLRKTNVKVFALGGIVTQKEIETLQNTDVFGFASIRYFQK